MVTFEQTENTDTGLDVAIKSEDGRILAWTYSLDLGRQIAWAMNNVWSDSEGAARCSSCDT